jgi:hypothetical protein
VLLPRSYSTNQLSLRLLELNVFCGFVCAVAGFCLHLLRHFLVLVQQLLGGRLLFHSWLLVLSLFASIWCTINCFSCCCCWWWWCWCSIVCLLVRVHYCLLRVLVRHLFPAAAAGAAFPHTASNASLVAATAGAALFPTAGSASLVTATAGAALFPAAAVLLAAASAGGLGCYSCSMVCSSLLLLVQYWARVAH